MQQLCCGVLLPVVVAALAEPRGAQQSQRVQQARQARQQELGCSSTALKSRAAALWAAAESALRAICRGEGLGGVPPALLAWVFLGNCWLLSRAVAFPAWAQDA